MFIDYNREMPGFVQAWELSANFADLVIKYREMIKIEENEDRQREMITMLDRMIEANNGLQKDSPQEYFDECARILETADRKWT